MTRNRTPLLALAFAIVLPSAILAQGTGKAATTKPPVTTKQATAPKPKVESQAALAKEARITAEAATATALAKVPGSTVKAKELEREGGKLIYSFELKVAGKAGIEEVNVDAMTGEIVGKVEHENDPAPKKPPVRKP